MFDFIKKIKMRYPYKYVPPCPKCGSKCTGRYVREPLTETDMEYIELNSLKNGEIVRFVPKEPTDNAFCVDCGHKWGCMITTRYFTKEQIEHEIDVRGTETAYQEIKAEVSHKELLSGKRKNSFL